MIELSTYGYVTPDFNLQLSIDKEESPFKCVYNRVSSFQEWICTMKHTLGHFKVSLIQGVPHFSGGFVL